jgi:threonine dehydratase
MQGELKISKICAGEQLNPTIVMPSTTHSTKTLNTGNLGSEKLGVPSQGVREAQSHCHDIGLRSLDFR